MAQLQPQDTLMLPAGYAYSSIEWVDLDNDGLLDVAAIATNAGRLHIITAKNDTISGWTIKTMFDTGFETAVYAWYDADYDNDIDLVMSGATAAGRSHWRSSAMATLHSRLQPTGPTAPRPLFTWPT
ncbi:MAG: VCBS repeat-containing protein [Bacteroidia bacterium]|nr:VCBS repeat-containing protein [Bacteroidia bacterium]